MNAGSSKHLEGGIRVLAQHRTPDLLKATSVLLSVSISILLLPKSLHLSIYIQQRP